MVPEKSEAEAASLKRWGIPLLGAFVAAILWSFVTETLLPLHRGGHTTEMYLNLIGFPIILFGTAVFAYGGYLIVRNTWRLFNSPEVAANYDLIKADTGKRAEASARNRNILFQAWKPGAIKLLLGFSLIATGSVIINWLKITGESQLM